MNKRTTVKELIDMAGGNLAEAARMTGYTRAAVHLWVKSDLKHIPELAEFRLRETQNKQVTL